LENADQIDYFHFSRILSLLYKIKRDVRSDLLKKMVGIYKDAIAGNLIITKNVNNFED
jgi:hypothetical protein